jgi:hypothetical protein
MSDGRIFSATRLRQQRSRRIGFAACGDLADRFGEACEFEIGLAPSRQKAEAP